MKKNSAFVYGLIGGFIELFVSIMVLYLLIEGATYKYYCIWGILYIIHSIIMIGIVFLMKKYPFAESLFSKCMWCGIIFILGGYIIPSIFYFLALRDMYSIDSDQSKDNYFEDMVSNKKTIPTKSKIFVQSYGEQQIADYLTDNDIDFNYDKQITLSFNEPNKNGYKQEWIRPDFYLNEFNIIIEYWGMKGDPDYDDKKDWKERVYAESKTQYISIYKEDLTNLEIKLEKKLKRLGVNL